MKCKYSDFVCPVEDKPDNIDVCKVCASMKSAVVEEKMIDIQRLQAVATLSASLPYEEKELQEKINDRVKKVLEKWLEGEEIEL